MKNLLSLGLLAAALTGCGPSVSKDSLPEVVRWVNDGNMDYLFADLDGTDISARLDPGDTLVLKVTNLPTGTQTYDPNALRKMLRSEVCEPGTFGRLIEQGGKVRFEFVSNFGKELPAIQFAHCG